MRARMNGFGIERAGLWAIARPLAAMLLVLALSLASLIGLARLGFSGANVDILRDGSQEIADYDALLADFRNFNNDAVVLVRSPALATAEGMERLRELDFELGFDERVESVLSVFSLVQYRADEGGWRAALPGEFADDGQAKGALDALLNDLPNARSLIDPASGSAVLVVYFKPDAVKDAAVRETMAALHEVVDGAQASDFRIALAGQPAIRAGMIDGIAGDLVRLLPLALVLCAALAWWLLGSLPAVAVVTAAPVLSALWLCGGMGLAGRDMDFLTSILPVLLVVVVFSDALHFHLAFEARRGAGTADREALAQTVREVGPPCVMSALTTALALASTMLSRNDGLIGFGLVGALGMIGGLVAILVAQPLATLAALRLGLKPTGARAAGARLTRLLPLSVMATRAPRLVVAASAVLLGLGLVAHERIDSRFSLVEYLSAGSSVAGAERFIDDNYPGSTPLFAVVRLDPDRPMLDAANTARFDSAIEAVAATFPVNSFYSLGTFRDELARQGAPFTQASLDALPDYLVSRFVSADRRQVLVTIFASANLTAAEMGARIGALRTALAERGLAEHVAVTGYPVLSAVVAPRLMDNLRLSLLSSIGLSIVLIGLSAGSWRAALACLMPNLLPILVVELGLWLAGEPLNLSVTVALTVAFGLAVNGSIHLLADYMRVRAEEGEAGAVETALAHVAPAMVSSTLILAGGLAILLLSTLPAIGLFAGVMILTLFLALGFDIFTLPANLLLVATRGADTAEPRPGDRRTGTRIR